MVSSKEREILTLPCRDSELYGLSDTFHLKNLLEKLLPFELIIEFSTQISLVFDLLFVI